MTSGRLNQDWTGQTGPVDWSDRSKLHSLGLELYFGMGFL